MGCVCAWVIGEGTLQRGGAQGQKGWILWSVWAWRGRCRVQGGMSYPSGAHSGQALQASPSPFKAVCEFQQRWGGMARGLGDWLA